MRNLTIFVHYLFLYRVSRMWDWQVDGGTTSAQRAAGMPASSIVLFIIGYGALLVSDARADDVPDWVVRIMRETHKRVVVEHQDWYAKDYRYIPAGQEIWGNCATFAFTAAVLANMAGHPGEVIPQGRAHVVAVADGWIFDARAYEPYRSR
ncbi:MULTISPECIES: hypothetical protein [Bradyrhizobium]|jgi:hypothetical protein|uniref:hypothetical protein n=1 Tax=Bradyrhizobium TaxID=374 RepID=UPI0004868C8F|nr:MULTISPECIES: hypothetical protein [Bradyrhizobium]MCS3451526.1 hypothetical protein [Bradyrhizobium elkanii]MCS3566375.1 hypothetical protein [Bradyrhizobium elkanii]MCW2152896.1 hypothetical protein [Bradyrhizobium elkanii]MCW2357370.1 hypothetical protein [Bradyrhizobium elkanii]MCW2376628.1 hypothetical protein [Bradyrhizobium elkanii]